MEKTIITGTKITFKETGDKFSLTQTETGFDFRQVKLSKNVPAEGYTFQELLGLYESGQITIEGFEEADTALVKSILTNYIHTTQIEALKADITRITGEKEALQTANQQLTDSNKELTTINNESTSENSQLTIDNSELTTANQKLTSENKELITKNEKLNTAIAAMDEQEK